MTSTHGPSVVILGSGFAGMGVAQELARQLPQQSECDITIVDQNDFFLFTPMLTEVAGGDVDPSGIVVAIRSISPRIRFVRGRVEHIDPSSKRVRVTVGEDLIAFSPAQRTLDADHLVIALGSVTNFHHIQGLSEHAIGIKSIEEAETIRNRAVAVLERANEEPDPHRRRTLLTFVVGGGGFSGVETMAALNDLVRDLVGAFGQLSPSDVRMVLVHPGSRLLPEINQSLATYAQEQLQRRGVEVMLNTMVSGAGDGYVEVSPQQANGSHQTPERISAYTLIWAGGVKPSPAVESAKFKLGRHHGIAVDACCAVPGHPGVWALGDCAEIPQPDGKGTYAPTAQNATREGTQVARNIVASMHGQRTQPFVYHPVGELAIVGKRTGVASVYGAQVSGTIAWAMWRIVYLAKLPRLTKRVRVAFDWLLDLVIGRDLVGLPGVSVGEPRGETAAGKAGSDR